MTAAQVTNEKTRLWNHSWSVVRQTVLDAGGSVRAANKARNDYLKSVGCTVIRSMIIWDERKFAISIMTDEEALSAFALSITESI